MKLDQGNARNDQILRTADWLGGAIVMQTIYAMFPDVQQRVLRRLVAKLTQRGALAWVWTSDIRCKVWLTTHGVDGREAGVRRWLKSPDDARRAIETGKGGRAVKLPARFAHNQIAGLVAVGIGGGVAEFERELWQQRGDSTSVADGYAWPASDRRIVIEVERMVGQSPHRWAKKGGLADRITASFRPNNEHPEWRDEYLVVAPRGVKLHADLEQSLAKLVEERAAKNHKNQPGAGWWFLCENDTEADPAWHPVLTGTPPTQPLPGIRSIRENFEAAHADRRRIDAARKSLAAAKNPEREAASPPVSRRASAPGQEAS